MRRTLLLRVKAIPLLMPAMSPTMERGQVSKWHKQIGDKIAVGDSVFAVETDKATLDVDAAEDGVMARHLVAEGKTVEVGCVIALMVGKGQDWKAVEWNSNESTQAKQQPAQQQSSAPHASSSSQQQRPSSAPQALPAIASSNEGRNEGRRKTKISFPSVSRLLEQYGLKASSVGATGALGQLLKEDVLNYIAKQKVGIPTKTAASAKSVPSSSSKVSHSYGAVDVDLAALHKLFGPTVPIQELVTAAAKRAQVDVPSVQSFSVQNMFATGVRAHTGILQDGKNAVLSIGGQRAILEVDGTVHKCFTLTLSAQAELLEDAQRFLGLVARHLQTPNEIF